MLYRTLVWIPLLLSNRVDIVSKVFSSITSDYKKGFVFAAAGAVLVMVVPRTSRRTVRRVVGVVAGTVLVVGFVDIDTI